MLRARGWVKMFQDWANNLLSTCNIQILPSGGSRPLNNTEQAEQLALTSHRRAYKSIDVLS